MVDLQIRTVYPVYIVVDVSGSTVQGTFIDKLNQAMPLIIDELALRDRASRPRYVGLLAFAVTTQTLITLGDPQRIEHIPAFRCGGLGLLSVGLRSAGIAIEEDAAQALADRGAPRAAARVVIVTDGMPTDASDELFGAYRELRNRTQALLGEVVVLVTADLVRTDLAVLGPRIVSLDQTNASVAKVASTVAECVFS